MIKVNKNNPSTDSIDIEHQINELVNQLYGLNPDEIAIVEGKD